MIKSQTSINSDFVVLNQREIAKKEIDLANRIIPQVILDSHIIIDAIFKIKGKDLALKYEVVALALQKNFEE